MTDDPNKFVGDIVRGLQQQKADLEQFQDIGGGVYTCKFFCPIKPAGEAVTQIKFPVRYVEKPLMTFGFEMAPNQILTPGKYPTACASVHSWKYGRRQDYGAKYYDGCTLVLVTTGDNALSGIFHINFNGKAMRNPAGQ